MPRKKQPTKQSKAMVTAALLAEVEANEEKSGKPPKRTATAKKARPTFKPMRETKAVLREREKVYKLLTKVWNDPKGKGLRPDDIPRYIRGLITAERGIKAKKDWDLYLFEELFYLIEFWTFRGD